jgi:hypothetical protein
MFETYTRKWFRKLGFAIVLGVSVDIVVNHMKHTVSESFGMAPDLTGKMVASHFALADDLAFLKIIGWAIAVFVSAIVLAVVAEDYFNERIHRIALVAVLLVTPFLPNP